MIDAVRAETLKRGKEELLQLQKELERTREKIQLLNEASARNRDAKEPCLLSVERKILEVLTRNDDIVWESYDESDIDDGY